MNNDIRVRNLLAQQRHNKDSFWQITFPLMIGSLLILSIAVWAVTAVAAGGQVGQAADTALIFLIIPVLMIAFIFLAILAGLVYGVIWLNKNIPFYTHRLQKTFARVGGQVQTVADKAASPLIKAQALSAALRAFGRAFRFWQ